MYVQINAGRNQDSTPMSTANWVRFQAALIEALSQYVTSYLIEVHYGQGTWDGVTEDSVHISYYSSESFDSIISPEQHQNFDREIGELKRIYCQDEIVVIVK